MYGIGKFRDGKEIRGARGRGGKDGHRVSIWDYGRALEMDSGDNCTPL